VFQSGRVLQERVEQLVIASRRHVEALLDRALLDPGVLPPRPLEVEDVYVELTESHVANLARPAWGSSDFPCLQIEAGAGNRTVLGNDEDGIIPEMPTLPSGTITILFTDIEGSTRLLREIGETRYADLLADHRRRLRTAFKAYGGVEVDSEGDAFFVAFSSAAEALAAASEGQAALAAGPIRVRMALHTGEPTVTSEGYVGMDVHRAARICATAHGGQVVVSSATHALLDDHAEFLDLGLHRLKDLGPPERLYQLGPSLFPPLRSLNATNLPAQSSSLIGREREVEELAALVAQERLLTLTGPGGTGKTRLALQVAAELVEAFEDGVFWVPLAPITNPDLISPTIASVIGATGDLHSHLGDRRMLLILDNLEQVLDAAPRLSGLLEGCARVHLLVTSRALLRVAGEREYRVRPLATDDAVALFRARAVAAEPAGAVAEICRRVDCLPLAVELAAARTSILPPSALLERLDRRLPMLTGGRRDAPERQRTLRAAIEWSHGLLSENEQRLFRRLAVFAGGFDPAGAEVVAGAELDDLQSLVEKSLVRRGASGRLGMLETIREFALERLEDAGETEDRRRRLAEHILAVAESACLSDEAEGPQRLEIVTPEAANLRAALEWSLAGDIHLGLRIAVALESYWMAANPFEGKHWIDLLLARAEGIPEDLRARALRVMGGATFIVGRFEEGTRLHEASLAAYRRLGDERGEGLLLHRLANSELARGNTVVARSLAEDSGERLRRVRFPKGELLSLTTLGEVELAEGNHERGFQLLREGATLADEVGFYWWKATTLAIIAENLVRLGRVEEAEQPARDALAEAHDLGERQWRIFALALLARMAAETGHAERAGTLWGAIESEEARGPVGQWEGERREYEGAVLAAEGQDFEAGRAHGRLLTIQDAVAYALG
jgi:predicted ATPase/class 3 adenylate cyclase